MPQLAEVSKPDARSLYVGVALIAIGLVKKVGLADTFAMWANAGFSHAASLTLLNSWATAISYTFQLYFDFSGYSDMAIGLGLLFGVQMPPNFNSPFRAGSIIDFWQRWHMTLTRFINAYVFTPLTRCFAELTPAKVLLSIFIVMVVTGLWHGANWTFVVFGMVHGGALVINHLWRRLGWRIPYLVGWCLTFATVVSAFVIFRAGSLAESKLVLVAMTGLHGVVLDAPVALKLHDIGLGFVESGNWFVLGELKSKFILLTLVALAIIVVGRNTRRFSEEFKLTWTYALLMGVVLVVTANLLSSSSNASQFLYFNF